MPFADYALLVYTQGEKMNNSRPYPKAAPARPLFRWRNGAAARFLVGLALAGTAGAAHAANTADNVANGSSNLTLAASYTGGLPTTTSDVVFTNQAYSPAAFTLNNSLSFGTLNDLSATVLSIQNTSGTADTLTLSTPANSVSGTAADLLYVASSGNLSLGGGAGNAALNLTLASAGNFNIAGTANIYSAISASGLTITKTGTGTLNLLGAGTSVTGQINQQGGTINFGSATDAPTYTATNGSVGVFVITGNFNMVNGSLTSTSTQGLVLNGTNTYTQTGGTFSTNGRIELANGGNTSTVNVSAGTLSSTFAGGGLETVRGTAVINLSGTGAIIVPVVDLTTTQLSGGAAGSTFNLNGGTLTTGQIIPGTNGTTGSGTVFNFNGGTLTSSASSTTFLQGLTSANVLAGGAVINTGTNNDTINQNLLASTTSTGGGLTKQGTGTLILGGANTYTGANVITAGTLGVTSDASLGAVPAAAATNIQLAGGTTLQDTTNNVTLSANRGISLPAGLTATLDSSTNAFTVGGAITVTGTSATATTLALNSGTGGAGDLTGTVSDTGTTGGVILNKTGAGAFTFGGSSASTLAKGQVSVTAGTFNFGSATEAPTLNLNGITGGGGNVGVYVKGGTFNMTAGTLVTSGTQQGLVVQGTNTAYNQTGGLLNTNADIIEFANAGTTTQNISGGELRTAGRIELNVNGTSSTTTVSGTGLITTPSLVMLSNQTNNNTSTSTFNLGNGGAGGTLTTGSVGHGTSTGTGATTFNFNGGTLKASASSTTFLTGLTAANVQSGGAVIDTNGKNDTIGQNLLAGTGGGGLAKQGTGTLTLTGANTYTGGTTITNGGLTAGADGSLGTGNVSVSSSGVLTLMGGTLNNYIGDTSSLFLASSSSATPFAFLSFTGTDIIGNLSFDGGATFAPAGTYGAVGSGALFTSSDFSGSGILSNAGLSAAPEPSQWAALLVGALCLGGLSLRARRRHLA